ncbi:hypothetical protein ACQWHU_25160, partial [Salmonella enterica subsp. enterica serovar Infantis]
NKSKKASQRKHPSTKQTPQNTKPLPLQKKLTTVQIANTKKKPIKEAQPKKSKPNKQNTKINKNKKKKRATSDYK